ncbi:hypothetical protein CEXT_188821 [Caerostris extrusa]|uniref:Uncharacterized protein n=1 Tax=Caerostris extrusa TaxID=172846 RepID=A0AAV4NQU4_CAEEX|nr:hypothetical protein CEXT_188821 [Caerostris extrusa]
MNHAQVPADLSLSPGRGSELVAEFEPRAHPMTCSPISLFTRPIISASDPLAPPPPPNVRSLSGNGQLARGSWSSLPEGWPMNLRRLSSTIIFSNSERLVEHNVLYDHFEHPQWPFDRGAMVGSQREKHGDSIS